MRSNVFAKLLLVAEDRLYSFVGAFAVDVIENVHKDPFEQLERGQHMTYSL